MDNWWTAWIDDWRVWAFLVVAAAALVVELLS